MSIYLLKSRFQDLLRPLVGSLAAGGVTANQVTGFAAVVSLAVGLALCLVPMPALFVAIPVWMLLRMGLNAIDGMLAREFGQKSALGGYLNEIGDVISDAALYAPFALVAPFSPAWVGAIVFLATLTELIGVLGVAHGNGRRYDGPMGKSDRAFVFGALGSWIAAAGGMPPWLWWFQPLFCLLLGWTAVKRVTLGLPRQGDR
ncbi:MAG: CDP-alcohol phosphatidyltransferase family protein [Alphaproteobacteria bacterium]|nr:CDP-alcohol phosphatidyltransferase family protein [Alphaproteobacteria bacterium]